MKMSKIVLALSLGMTLVTAAHAEVKDQGHGTVHFVGSIIDAPCSIDPDSVDQTIKMGAISNAALKDGGRSEPVDFKILLTQCDVSTLTDGVTVTFSGSPSTGNAELLGITGSASGASIALIDGAGSPIKLGEASVARPLVDGSNEMDFAAFLQGDAGASAAIVPGSFTSVANFTLSYN
ncbi:PapA family protein [Buttiauxella brennerae ATCC 51605]|uniref:PapA family protein n=1 Tax=Buttiauxella brennerae ATCC 51605 TaxID=1354251 RepID=A0A1B7INJ3_9ENTR|nr:fimbrial protein [Buttiauxella brennerae]OAT31263.1 PapA family protein [Buttiauxella brennerae ATCC 51605]